MVVPAAGLGVVHGGIGVLEQGVRVHPIERIDAHTCACRDEDLAPVQLERAAKTVPDAVCGACCRRDVLDVRGADRELIAPKPTRDQRRVGSFRTSQGVPGAKAVGESVPNVFENLVPEPVAERVVNLFEPIQIKKNDCKEPPLLFGEEQSLRQLGSEGHPVGQAGEDIIVGEFQELVRVSLRPQRVFDTFTEYPPIHWLRVEVRGPDVVGAGHGLRVFRLREH